MKTLREFVSCMSDDTMLQILKDQEHFEAYGAIGDSELRNQASEFIYQLGIPEHQITFWMDRLVMEIYRRFAIRHINPTAGA